MMFHFRHIRQSLWLKLSFGILLLAMPIFVLAIGILFLQSRHNVRDAALARATSILNTTTQRVNYYMTIVETATNITAWLVNDALHPDSLLSYSRRVVQFNAEIDGCSISLEPNVLPAYGRYFSVYSILKDGRVESTREPVYEYFDRVWYATPRNLGKACWVDFYDDADTLQLTLEGRLGSYCKPLYDARGRFIGVMSSDVSLRRLSKVITAEKPFPHSYFMMLGQDGSFFVHPDTLRLFRQTIFSRADARRNADVIALGHDMLAGGSGIMSVTIDGEDCLVCYQPVPDTPWSLALVCPKSDIFSGYYRLSYILVLLVVIGLLLILWLCRRVVAHAISPVNRLVDQSRLLAEGHYDNPLPRSPRLDAIGQLNNVFVHMQESINRHVTSISEVNADMARRNEELAHANELAKEANKQKVTFIQNVTHQIRTPLNIIMGFAQVLADNLKQFPEEEVKSVTSLMNHNANALSRMVLMLFDSSETGINEERGASQHYEDVPCNAVARESLQFMREYFPDLPVTFETDVPDTFCIHTNKIYLMRSLREILYNSAKYSDGQHIKLRLTKTATSVLYIVEDTGPGIAEKDLELMFKPFSKVNDLSEGLGLGLPLAKRHIVNLGGTLALDVTYHEGCRFIIELPLQPRQ